jgi:hypothetical protein
MQAETGIIAAPNGVVSISWIDLDNQSNSTIGYTFSSDGGASFAPTQQIISPGGRVASDPVMARDLDDNLWVTWVAFRYGPGGQPSQMAIYVAEAPAGSTAFGAPIQVSPVNDSGAMYDKPWITVTNTGTILVTYERDLNNNDLSIVATRSVDKGATWQQSFVARDQSGSTYRNLAFPCAPRTGNHLWATYVAFVGSSLTPQVRLARSDDGGATWLPEVNVSTFGEKAAFEDPSCAADGENVWVAYGLSKDQIDQQAATTQKLNSLQLAYSADGGSTFALRSEIADAKAGTFTMHPQIVIEDGGALDLVYYAGGGDEDPNGTYRFARAPAPATASPFAQSLIVESPVTFLQARSDARWLGDYTGLAWYQGAAYTSYVQNSSGMAHIAFAKIPTP